MLVFVDSDDWRIAFFECKLRASIGSESNAETAMNMFTTVLGLQPPTSVSMCICSSVGVRVSVNISLSIRRNISKSKSTSISIPCHAPRR